MKFYQRIFFLTFFSIAAVHADDFTDILQDLAVQTACIGQYSATQAGGTWSEDPYDYYKPYLLAERFKKMSGNMTRTTTFYGVCFDYAEFAYWDIKGNENLYVRNGMRTGQFFLAGDNSNPNIIELSVPTSNANATKFQNGIPVRTYGNSSYKNVKAHKAQNGEVIAFEGDTSYWNLDYRDNFYKYCCKWIIKDKVTEKKIKQDFKEGKENLVTADSKKEGTRRHYFAYMPMGINGWMICYAVSEQAAQQSYNFIEDYEISFMIVFIILVTLLIMYIVYENHTRNKELLKYAQTDALTGLYNKETTERLTDELLSEDGNKFHAFLILDLDCFKQINDIYGHAVGDIVLQRFGKLLKSTFREGDILGRIGGDEFVVIMKNIQTKDIATKKAGEFLAKTQAYKIDELKGNNISISIGISTAPQDGDCYMDLYKCADQALYQAKRSGKARVCNYFS